MATESELIEAVDSYLNRQEGQYAILIYGEWGCGKTRFVQNNLKRHLEDNDKPILSLRASAFGVSTGEELMGRIVSALINERAGIVDETSSRNDALKALLKNTGLSGLNATGIKVLKKLGISYTASPQLILSFLLPKKSLIVIDDLERCSIEEGELFGAINDLVETHNLNVILVAKSVDNVPAELVEKLVWKKYRFTPNPFELVASTIGEEIAQIGSIDTTELIVESLKARTNLNARLLQRIKPLLILTASSSFFACDKTDDLIQKNVFSDIVSLSCEVAEQGGIAAVESQSDDPLEHMRLERINERHEKCKSLRFIESYLNGGSEMTVEDLNASLSSYAIKYHPQTAREMAAITAVDRIKFWEFEDDEGQNGLEAIKEALSAKEVALVNIPRCIRAVKSLMRCGIATAQDLEDALASSREILLTSTTLSIKVFNAEGWFEWHTSEGPSELQIHEVDALRKEIEREHASRVSDALIAGVDTRSEDSGSMFVDNVRELAPLDAFAMTKIDPVVLAKIIASSSVASIGRIRSAIYELSKFPGEKDQSAERREWFADLNNELADTRVPSKTRSFHIYCLKEDLRKYLNERRIAEDEPAATSD